MAQRASGYQPAPHDLYETPEHATEALLSVYRIVGPVLEPACASGKIVRVLKRAGLQVVGTDLIDRGSADQDGQGDFLRMKSAAHFATILTNPPFGTKYALAIKFIDHAIELMRPQRGQVVMLLPADFDFAITRRYQFADHPAFKHVIKLHKRLKWIDMPVEPGKRSSGPSTYSAWFVWDWMHTGGSTNLYAGKAAA